ncbi:MAG: sulfatase-like hydrolase/transferase [Planctomycetes bacterium]|nr:sulfatase-like hydrolase/transferase [Planctomycetota bacterium]
MARKRRIRKERQAGAAQPRALPDKPREARGRRWIVTSVVLGLVTTIAVLGIAITNRTDRWPAGFSKGSASGFNLLLITLDTTRADHLGCYGYETAQTPVLDGLASSGVRFAHALTAVPITLPSHATILTGLYPPHHGARNNGDLTLDGSQVTLAEILKKQGYETGAFISAFVLDARFGLDQGFDLYDNDVELDQSSGMMSRIAQRKADEVTDVAVEWLESRDVGRPFFAWVHYYDPHRPYKPPPAFAGRFAGDLYDAEIAFMDAEIGRLLAALDKKKLRDKTLIVVVGDHGESLGEHNENTHALLVYDSSMKVPLIFTCTGLFSGGAVIDDFTAATVDVFPTVLELLGVDHHGPGDGMSLVETRIDRDRAIYMETYATFLNHGWAPLSALHRHDDKYILAPVPEYYDLAADPNELDNIYDTVSGRQLVLRDQLVSDLADRLSGWPSLEGLVESAQQLDPETIRKLESLGYVGTGSGAAAAADPSQLPDPKDMMPVMRMVDEAQALEQTGEYERALVLLQKAERLSPRNNHVLYALGKNLLWLSRETKAEEVLKRANEIKVRASVLLLLAQIKIKQREFEVARLLLDQAEERDPNLGAIYVARGDIVALQGNADGAIAEYERGKKIDPYRVAKAAEARIAGVRQAWEQSRRQTK